MTETHTTKRGDSELLLREADGETRLYVPVCEAHKLTYTDTATHDCIMLLCEQSPEVEQQLAYNLTQTYYLILFWFVREVAQAVRGKISMRSRRAACRNATRC